MNDVFPQCEKAGRLEHFSFLVYWYGAKSLREAYSYVTKSTLRLSATHREYQKGVTEYENALKKVKTCEQAGKKVPASVQEKAQKYNEMLQDMQTPPEERRGVETTVVKGYDLLTMSDVEETGALGSEMQESDNDDDEEREEIDSSSKKKGVWWKDYKMLPAATVMQRKVSADKSEDPTATLSASARSVSSSPTTAKQSLQRKRPPREDSLDERKPSARPAKRAKNKLSSSTKPPIVLTKEQEERVNEIREWLTKVGFEPLREEMEVYARKFIVIGFPSVKSIVKLCTKEDIAGFDWINSYHKRWVTAALDQD